MLTLGNPRFNLRYDMEANEKPLVISGVSLRNTIPHRMELCGERHIASKAKRSYRQQIHSENNDIVLKHRGHISCVKAVLK